MDHIRGTTQMYDVSKSNELATLNQINILKLGDLCVIKGRFVLTEFLQNSRVTHASRIHGIKVQSSKIHCMLYYLWALVSHESLASYDNKMNTQLWICAKHMHEYFTGFMLHTCSVGSTKVQGKV